MLEIIKRTGIFLILAETLYQFVQENRYARYVRVLIRLMTIAILVVPVLDFFKEGSNEAYYGNLSEYFALLDGGGIAEEYADPDTEQMLLQQYADADTQVMAQTESELKAICNACAGEYGYLIQRVTMDENGICFVLIRSEKEGMTERTGTAGNTDQTGISAENAGRAEGEGGEIYIEEIRIGTVENVSAGQEQENAVPGDAGAGNAELGGNGAGNAVSGDTGTGNAALEGTGAENTEQIKKAFAGLLGISSARIEVIIYG